MPSATEAVDAVVVGAGLAGLACSLRLLEAGKRVTLLEASDAPGGRVRTDEADGYLLDRGFQVLLTGYPEARAQLDYAALDLRPFEPGALVRHAGRWHRLSDPWRRPGRAIATALSGVATLADKLRIAWLRSLLRKDRSLDAICGCEATTADALRRYGFSPVIIERFFRPFLGGVFLERELETSSRMFEFVFGLFGSGDVALPGAGMQAIPAQLAARLAPGVLRLGSAVTRIDDDGRVSVGDESLRGEVLVIATDGPAADRLLGVPASKREGRRVTNIDFAADHPPFAEPILMLNGDGPAGGPINNLCVPSQVAPRYAPAGKALVSATVLGDPAVSDGELTADVRRHAREWFGPSADAWRPLRVTRIAYALPDQSPPHYQQVEKSLRVRDRVFVCGDRFDTASIDGALRSGRRAAEAVLRRLE
ncbi:MAG: NAD(P)/FAD-dependent oxidoreductase [Lacipirellulaceae bacterium]